MSGRLDRREFLGTTVAAGVGAVVLGQGVAQAAESGGKSVVVKVVRDNATADKKVNAAVVREMVHAAVCKLSGKAKPEEAWACYVKPTDVVAIKINCLFGIGACTHPEVTAAVAEGCQMAGVPADKIFVWDRATKDLEKSGYKMNSGPGVKYVANDGVWEDEPTEFAGIKGKFAKILTKECTALINVPVLKTHVIAGMTMALKNHYGSFHNPKDAHPNGCDPFIAELNALPFIKNKTRLIVADALAPVAEGGPQAKPQFTLEYNAILASTDPVAIDAVGVTILEEQRAKLKLPTLASTGKVKCLATAAAKGLGVADMSKIDLVTV